MMNTAPFCAGPACHGVGVGELLRLLGCVGPIRGNIRGRCGNAVVVMDIEGGTEDGSEGGQEVVVGVGNDTTWREQQDCRRQAAGGRCMSGAQMHQKDDVQ